MTGRLIGVVGPSGVGKDSVMAGLCAARPDLLSVRRVITRDAALGGEDFTPASVTDFMARREAGEFLLHWGAHGLFYGIPRSLTADLAAGHDCIANLSRTILAQAAGLFARFTVLHLTADPDVLAARLSSRGRENAVDIAARLSRAQDCLADGLPIVEVANNGTIDATVRMALTALYPESA
jgi:ribose 1,5-bisphosphokinase